ncbi:MAG: molybdenum cofactor guanylyltransferase, partial [Armatimonadota bacterium]
KCCECCIVIHPESVQVPADVESRCVQEADPLELIKQALVWANHEPVLVLSSDLKNPSAPLAEYLDFVRAGYDAVIPMSDDETPQPFFAIYTPACLSALNTLLLSGRHRVAPLLEAVNTRFVEASEVAKFGEPEMILARE